MIRTTVASEWAKLWSVRSTWWATVAALVLMLLTSAQVAIWVTNGDADIADAAGNANPSDVAVSAFGVAQLAVIALAMLVVTGEYAHGTMLATLQWTPARTRVLVAKAAVVAAVTGVTGAILVLAGTLVAAPLLGDHSAFDAAGAGRDVVAVAVCSALLGLLALGLGAALRGAVLTLVTLFLLLVLLPQLLAAPDVSALTRVADLTPGPAGAHFVDGGTDPYPPLVGVAVLAVWALAALVAGARVLRHRDA